jgi:membrane protein involved in colicin uptake
VAGTTLSKSSHKAEEAARVAAAKRQIEDDRNAVKDRVERERVGRDARAAAEAQAERERVAREAKEAEEERARAARREARGPTEGGRTTHPAMPPNMTVGATATATVQPQEGRDDEFEHEYPEDEDDVDSDEGYWNQHRWGQGNKLGQ